MFIGVYRLEIQSVMLEFSTQLWTVVPLTFSLVSSPDPLPCVNKYTAQYTSIQCVKGGGWGHGRGGGRRQIDRNLPQSPFIGFLDDDILLWCLYGVLVHGRGVRVWGGIIFKCDNRGTGVLCEHRSLLKWYIRNKYDTN